MIKKNRTAQTSVAERLMTRLGRWLQGESEEGLKISYRCLDQLSPFHLVLNADGIVVRQGPSWDKLLGADATDKALNQLLRVDSDDGGNNYTNLNEPSQLEERAVLVRLAKGNINISLTMQTVKINQNTKQEWICDIRTNISTIEELSEAKLTLQDLSLIDPLRSNMLELLMRESLQKELLGALREQNE